MTFGQPETKSLRRAEGQTGKQITGEGPKSGWRLMDSRRLEQESAASGWGWWDASDRLVGTDY